MYGHKADIQQHGACWNLGEIGISYRKAVSFLVCCEFKFFREKLTVHGLQPTSILEVRSYAATSIDVMGFHLSIQNSPSLHRPEYISKRAEKIHEIADLQNRAMILCGFYGLLWSPP
jgi:hypothetical protein